MRSKQEVSNEITKIQQRIDKLLLEIGQGYAMLRKTGDSKIIVVINSKVEVVHKLEEQMEDLNRELNGLAE